MTKWRKFAESLRTRSLWSLKKPFPIRFWFRWKTTSLHGSSVWEKKECDFRWAWDKVTKLWRFFLRVLNILYHWNTDQLKLKLRWLNTVLRAVSGNSSDGACFKLDKQTRRRKSSGTEKTIFQNLLICQNFYFYLILNDENFKMEVEQTNFVTHLIITVQLYYWLSENPSVKIWSNKFQIVMINYSKPCESLYENLMSEFSVNWAKVKF